MKTKNKLKNGFWEFRNEAEENDDEPAELLLYGEISGESWWGDETTPQQFAEALNDLDGRDLTIRINSGGGDVFAAQAIYNQLKTYKGKKTVRIDGLAASAATLVTCAGDTVIMPDNALFMIHNPACLLFDFYDVPALTKMAERLETVKQTITNVYLKKTKGSLSEDEIKQMMDAETWMTADEASGYGFVDETDEETPVENSFANGCLIVNSVSCDVSRFKNQQGMQKVLNHQRKAKKRGVVQMNNNDLLERIKNLLGMNEPANPEPQPTVQNQNDDPVQSERARMMALDALDDHTNPAVSKIINAAKANGSTAEQVKPFVDVLREESQKNAQQNDAVQAIKNLIQDNMQSGAANVVPSTTDPQFTDAAKKQAAIDEIVKIANEKRG